MNFYFRIYLILTIAISLGACKKDIRELDASVQPEDDLLTAQYNESAKLFGYAQNQVSVYSLNDRFKFLGTHKNPVFGKVEVGLYLNINTTLANITFTDTPILDSAEFVFTVDLGSFDGGVDALLTFSVFPLDSSLSDDRNYTTSQNGFHNPVALPTISTVKVVQGSTGNTLRVKLDKTFAQQFISNHQYLTSNEEIQKQYKGFYLLADVPAGSNGGIFRCDLEDPSTGLFFYASSSDTSKAPRTEKFSFAGSSAVRFNTVKQDLSSAHSALISQTPADSASSSHFFVKGLGVTNTRIMIPDLTYYGDSAEYAINRAEITFNVDNSIPGASFLAPPALCLLPLTPAGRDTFAIDQLATIDNVRYGGIYSVGKYTFNITRHVQAIVNGQMKNNGFVLVVANPERLDLLNINGTLSRIIRRDYYSEGIVLYGPAAVENAPRLKLSFVRLNNK